MKAFVTFRVTGDKLVPADVTKLLKMQATDIRHKGIPSSTGRSNNIIPSTNIWFFSTDKVVASNNLYDHVALVLYLIGLERENETEPTSKNISEKLARLLSLKNFLQKHSAKAVMSFFWHGGPSSELA